MTAVAEGNRASLSVTFRRLAFAALGPLFCLALLDLLLVRGTGRAAALLNSNAFWLGLWVIAPVAAGTGFFVTLLLHLGDRPEPNVLKPALLSIALAAIWLFAAFTAVVNFHLLIGGRL